MEGGGERIIEDIRIIGKQIIGDKAQNLAIFIITLPNKGFSHYRRHPYAVVQQMLFGRYRIARASGSQDIGQKFKTI